MFISTPTAPEAMAPLVCTICHLNVQEDKDQIGFPFWFWLWIGDYFPSRTNVTWAVVPERWSISWLMTGPAEWRDGNGCQEAFLSTTRSPICPRVTWMTPHFNKAATCIYLFCRSDFSFPVTALLLCTCKSTGHESAVSVTSACRAAAASEPAGKQSVGTHNQSFSGSTTKRWEERNVYEFKLQVIWPERSGEVGFEGGVTEWFSREGTSVHASTLSVLGDLLPEAPRSCK